MTRTSTSHAVTVTLGYNLLPAAIPNMASHPGVLTIAGSDSGGGAGIQVSFFPLYDLVNLPTHSQAELKTIAALGCYGTSAITALTAQNTKGVTGIHAVPTDFVESQVSLASPNTV